MIKKAKVVIYLDTTKPTKAIQTMIALNQASDRPRFMVGQELVEASSLEGISFWQICKGMGIRPIFDSRLRNHPRLVQQVKALDQEPLWGITLDYKNQFEDERAARIVKESLGRLICDQGGYFGRRYIAHIDSPDSGYIPSRFDEIKQHGFWGAIVPPYSLKSCIKEGKPCQLLVWVNKDTHQGVVILNPKEAAEIGADYVIVDVSSLDHKNLIGSYQNLFC